MAMIKLMVEMSFDIPVSSDLKASLLMLVKDSNLESGCIQYEVFVNDKTASVIFIEQWNSESEYQMHKNGHAISRFKKQSSQNVVSKYQLSQL